MQTPAVLLDVNLQALKVIRSLGRQGIPVVGVVPRKGRWEHSTRYCDIRVCEQALEYGDELRDYLIDLSQTYDTRPILIPMHDDNVLFIAKYDDELRTHYRYLSSDPTTMKKLVTKSGLSELAASCGIPQPNTFSPKTRCELQAFCTEIKYPVLIKPIFSRSWQKKDAQRFVNGKVVVVSNEDQLLEKYESLASFDSRLVIQELIPGPDNNLLYYIGYYDNDSNPLASFVGIKERVTPIHFGSASFVLSHYDEQLIAICAQFMKKIGYKGHVGIEFKYDDRDSRYKLIEVNTRFGLWDGLPALCGIDFAIINYRYLLGLPISVKDQFENGVKWVSFERDFAAFRQYQRENRITFFGWLKSVFSGKRDYAVFASDDPMPFVLSSIDFARQLLGKKLRSIWYRTKTNASQRSA